MTRVLPVLMLAVFSTYAPRASQAGAAKDAPASVPVPGAVYVARTASRVSVCLNGKWSFQPAASPSERPPAAGWARISVPGVWNKPWQTEVTPDGGAAFGSDQLEKAAFGWFQRTVDIPTEASGRKIVLDIRDVSGLAKVFVNGSEVGTIAQWGALDITSFVAPGKSCDVSLLVAATSTPRGTHTVFEGPAVEAAPPLEDRGILGDVFLSIMPRGAIIQEAEIRTSVSSASWRVASELTGLTPGAEYELRIEALADDGTTTSKTEVRFTADGASERVPVETVWRGARRWEIDDPYLYQCVVRLFDGRGALLDEYRDEFGFREFGVVGSDFILNARKIRLRPRVFTGAWEHIPTFCPPLIQAQLRGIKADGFNTVQFWPDAFHPELEHLAAEADRLGILLILPLEGMVERAEEFRELGYVDPAWREQVRRQIGLIGNHPSIVMWGVSPNVFGTALPPFFVPGAPVEYAYLNGLREGARIAYAAYRELDPSRPVFFHASDVGDVSAPNIYLNLMPLQEQRDFLDIWASEKAYPLLAIECGLPISESLLRFRRPGFDAWRSAPFATEAAAIYLGDEAYALEGEEYLKRVETRFRGSEAYTTWQFPDPPNQEENSNRVSALFVKERWRAWRAWGITGGMVPWEYEDLSYVMGENWVTPADNAVVEVGARSVPGCWPDRVFRGQLVPWTVGRSDATTKFARAWRPVGRAFQEVNQPILAFIGGPQGAQTDQRHNYYGGAMLSREIIAIYDGDRPQAARLDLRWQLRVASEAIASSERTVRVPCGEDVRVPIKVALPQVSRRTEGAITLYANGRLVDRYAFTVFPAAAKPKLKRRVIALDPVGLTSRMLRGFDLQPQPLTGRPGSDDLLVIGRQALSEDSALSFDLAGAVGAGLNVVVFSQPARFWEERMGWRTSWHASRRFWTSHGAGELLTPLRDDDLADWAGSGTLLPSRYPYPKETIENYPPPQPIWHIGNRGTVASVALEKPHYGNFTPLLEGEYDLAYSPLLRLRYGRGTVYVVQLDLEDNCGIDPAADHLLAAILRMADEPAPDAGLPLMTWAGKAEECRTHLAQGGNVLVASADESQLEAAAAALGVSLTLKKARLHGGGTGVAAWPELQGVSAADLHWRGFLDATVIDRLPGGEIAANGLLGKKRLGNGTVFFCLVTPSMFPLPPVRERRPRPDEFGRSSRMGEKTYFRISRWRADRLLSQIKANLGAQPAEPERAFLDRLSSPLPKTEILDLSGPGWSAKYDEASGGERQGWALPGAADEGWTPAALPVTRQEGTPWGRSGACWFRKSFPLPAAMRGRRVAVRLYTSDTEAFVYLNGRELVQCLETRASYAREKLYLIPDGLLAEDNTLALEVYGFFGNGGITSGPLQLETVDSLPFYNADYDYDDNLYRWNPW